MSGKMALTPELVARASRAVPDPGPEPHIVYQSDSDYDEAVAFFRERLGPAARPDQVTTRLLRAFLAWLHDQGYARTTISRRIAAVPSGLVATPADRWAPADRHRIHLVRGDL